MLATLQAPSWPINQGPLMPEKAPVPLPEAPHEEQESGRPQSLTPAGARLERVLLAVADALVAAAPDLDALDSRQPSNLLSYCGLSIIMSSHALPCPEFMCLFLCYM